MVGIGWGRGAVLTKAADQGFSKGMSGLAILWPARTVQGQVWAEHVPVRRKLTEIAVQSMDYVNRYENRTIWGSGKDMENKWGAVKVIMRARPAGMSCPAFSELLLFSLSLMSEHSHPSDET